MPFAMCPPDYNININISTAQSTANVQQLVNSVNQLSQAEKGIKNALDDKGSATQKNIKSLADYDGNLKTLNADLTKNRELLKAEIALLTSLKTSTGTTSEMYKKQDAVVRNLEKTINSQRSTLSLYNKELGITSTKTKQATSGLQGLTTTFNKLGAVMGISFGLYGAFRVLQGGIKTIAEFDLAQKKLQSILSETSEGMKVMSKSAIEVGKASVFGAAGVSQLQIELAKMGFTKDEIVAMQQAIVNLATATQEDLASSAETVANILRAFDLTAGESTMVVDIMGKAFNDSALDLANFREAIKYVAPIAKQANFTFAETTALLEQLSNAGIKGSLAGTGLTNIISRLGNENSKFAKTLGRTVDGFDDFIAGLIELKDRGIDITGVFELVDRRAAAVFSILLDGTETVKQFKEKLEDASGVMEKQAAVQLDSITYRAKLAKESWKAFILEMDSGNGVISETIKYLLSLSDAIVIAMGDPILSAEQRMAELEKSSNDVRRMMAEGWGKLNPAQKDEYDELINNTKDYYFKLDKLTEEYNKKVEKVNKSRNPLQFARAPFLLADLKNELKADMLKLQQEYPNIIGELAGEKGLLIQKDTDRFVARFKEIAEASGDVTLAFKLVIDKLIEFKKQAKESNDALSVEKYTKAIKRVGDEYERISGFSAVPDITPDLKDNANKTALELLEIQKKISETKIKIAEDGFTEERALIEDNYLWEKKIIEASLLNNEVKQKKLELLQQQYFLSIQELGVKEYEYMLKEKEKEDAVLRDFYKSWNDLVDDTMSDNAKAYEDSVKDIEKWIEDYFEAFAKNKAKIDDLNKKSPLLGALTPKKSASEIAEMTDEEIKSLENSFDVWGDSMWRISDGINDLVDSWVDGMNRVVDARNNMVEEAQNALEIELQLAEQGYASNVSLKQKELEAAKVLREKALKDQQKAQKVQLALDSAQQFSALATTIANYFQSTSRIPIVGVALAIGAVTTMLATFAKFKNLAKEQAAIKYGEGGWVGGKLHREGGTTLEAEKGEFITNRKSSLKHAKLLEAINNDDSYTLNRLYINNLKGQIVNARVSLDDSKDLKAIRSVLEKENRKVEYYSNYRIEKNGNVTTKILLN